MALEGRQHRKRLEVRLQARALTVVRRQIAGEHPLESAGLVRRQPKDAQMDLVIADDVYEVTPANNPARGTQMGRPSGPGRLLHVQFAQLGEMEGRKLLGPRALPLH